MNQELLDKFVKAVEAGKVEGCEIVWEGDFKILFCNDNGIAQEKKLGVWSDDIPDLQADNLCAHLRRWVATEHWITEADIDATTARRRKK